VEFFFYDALTGEEIDRLFVDSYFKREEKSSREMDYSFEVIKTEGFDWSSKGTIPSESRLRLYAKQLNTTIKPNLIGLDIPRKSANYDRFVLSGAAIGASLGIFLGSAEVFWLGVIFGIGGGVGIGKLEESYRKERVRENFKELFRFFENYKVW
jgi:hypothetical protein